MGRKKPSRKRSPESKKDSRWGFRGMTVRDWLQLLIVPFALVVIGFLFAMQQDARQQKIEDQRAQQAQMIENQRAKAELDLADQRAQDEALQAYLDQMSSLLLDKDRPLRQSKKGDEVRTLARARTLTVLDRMDPSRKGEVIQFLSEAGLVERVEGNRPILSLNGADLSDANLEMAFLIAASLWFADLSGADLSLAILHDAELLDANLHDANLWNVDLSDANLASADLRDANLRKADLREAFLLNANLSGANLSGANLRGAILQNADLEGAQKVTKEQIEQQAASLEGATMPDGQKYEDWLKSRGEDGKNPDPS